MPLNTSAEAGFRHPLLGHGVVRSPNRVERHSIGICCAAHLPTVVAASGPVEAGRSKSAPPCLTGSWRPREPGPLRVPAGKLGRRVGRDGTLEHLVKPMEYPMHPADIMSRPQPIAATIAGVTRQTGLSRSEIYRLLARGKLKAVKSGRSTLVLMESVVAHLASLPEATFRPPVE